MQSDLPIRFRWNPSPREIIIAAAKNISEAIFFSKRNADFEEKYDGKDISIFRGEWPNAHIEPLRDVPLNKQSSSHLHIALVPSNVPYDAPAYLRFDNWNECPAPEEHVALFKYWYERYGAEPVSIMSDIIEMYVSRPPSTRAEALALADEQFLYCEDIVLQGIETTSALATGLLNGCYWYFWWD